MVWCCWRCCSAFAHSATWIFRGMRLHDTRRGVFLAKLSSMLTVACQHRSNMLPDWLSSLWISVKTYDWTPNRKNWGDWAHQLLKIKTGIITARTGYISWWTVPELLDTVSMYHWYKILAEVIRYPQNMCSYQWYHLNFVILRLDQVDVRDHHWPLWLRPFVQKIEFDALCISSNPLRQIRWPLTEQYIVKGAGRIPNDGRSRTKPRPRQALSTVWII